VEVEVLRQVSERDHVGLRGEKSQVHYITISNPHMGDHKCYFLTRYRFKGEFALFGDLFPDSVALAVP
jgi:hypothetical protein